MLTSVICQVVYIKKRNFARWLFDWRFRTKEGMGVSFMTKLTFRLNFAVNILVEICILAP